ncbi:RDD family protein [Arcobacter roscoffensis]|uniref:RDD family protein n=1 Tax=Arcobacter roscoffensis TaxID=2961520 RepID=A0ABY5E367_9BACT|nr:RDD family protein [Arcobacter roscoffensis]UTJ05210.1 RDD family protein [Arcobacter roscoffensis]
MQNNSSQDLQLATLSSRAMAFVIDDLLVTFLVIAMFWDKITNAGNSMESMVYLMKVEIVGPLIMLKVVYHTFFVWYYGATIGKIITKIRVIDYNTLGRISIFSSLLRAIGRVFSEWFVYIGFIIAFFNDGKRTFHDYTGKTLVVNV